MVNKTTLVFIVFFISNLLAFSLENLEFNRNEQQYYIEISPNVYGINTSFYIWTGNLDGTASTNSPNARDNTYALTGYGGDYSHGIFSLGIVYNFLRVSIGYDSEEIRNKIQNGWHHFFNRPRVPLLNRSNRFYFQVSLFNSELQY